MRQSNARGHGMARLAAAGAVLGVCCLGTASAAHAATPVTLNYTCSVPVIGDQPMTVSLAWDAAPTHRVGQSTQSIPLTITAEISSETTDALNILGAASVHGTADVAGAVVAPQGDINGDITMTVGNTAVPNFGPLTFTATGTLPPAVFTKPGAAQLVVGNTFTYSFTAQDASGEQLGYADATCSLNPGQSGLIATFEILAAAAPAPPSASSTTTTPTSRTSTTTTAASASSHGNVTGGVAGSVTRTTSAKASAAANPVGSTRVFTPPKTVVSAASASSSASEQNSDFRPVVAAKDARSGLAETQVLALAAAVVVAMGTGLWWLSRRRRRNDQGLTYESAPPVVPAADSPNEGSGDVELGGAIEAQLLAHAFMSDQTVSEFASPRRVQVRTGSDRLGSAEAELDSADVGNSQAFTSHKAIPGLVRPHLHDRRRRAGSLSRQCRERDRHDRGIR